MLPLPLTAGEIRFIKVLRVIWQKDCQRVRMARTAQMADCVGMGKKTPDLSGRVPEVPEGISQVRCSIRKLGRTMLPGYPWVTNTNKDLQMHSAD